MFAKILLLIGFGGLSGVIYILNATSPATAGPLIILLLFVCFYITTVSALSFLLVGIMNVVKFVTPLRLNHAYTLKDCYYLSSILALAPMLLVGMQSVGRLNWYEVILVLVFEVIAVFYMVRKRYGVS